MPPAAPHGQLSSFGSSTLRDGSDALLLDLYACPSAPTRWGQVLDQLCMKTGARSAILQALRVEGPGMQQYWSAQDSYSCRAITPRMGRLADNANPRLDIQYRERGLDRFVRDEDLFGCEERAMREYQAQLAGIGLGRFMGSLWRADCNHYVSLALHRAVGDSRDFSMPQIEWLTALSPHLNQAANLGQKLAAADSFSARLQRHFDRLRCGMMICDRNSQVLWANRSAEQLLVATAALRLHAGSLTGSSRLVTEALMREIAAVAATGNGSYLALGQGQVLHLALQSLDDGCESLHGNASVLLILTTPEMGCLISPKAIGRLFAVTPAESRLASALMAGLSLEQYALRQNVSLGTVRGQLKQVLAKTGTSRQSELVRLVLSSAAAQVTATD